LDKLLKLTLFKFGVFIIFKILICVISVYLIGGGGTFNKTRFLVLIAVILIIVSYDIKFLWSNYPKHLFLKKTLGKDYEVVLYQNIEKSGAIELFYRNWFIKYWESYTSEKGLPHN